MHPAQILAAAHATLHEASHAHALGDRARATLLLDEASAQLDRARAAIAPPSATPGDLLALLTALAAHFSFDPAQLTARRRDVPLAFARQVAMTLARRHTRHSLEIIGRAFRRDHGTVRWAERALAARRATEPAFAATYAAAETAALAALAAHRASLPLPARRAA